MGRPVRLLLVGFGAANQAVLRLALTKPWLEVQGIVVRSKQRDGEMAAQSVSGAPPQLRCTTDLASALESPSPDIAIVATATRLRDVLPVLETIARARVPILCTAEDLAHVESTDADSGARIHALALDCGVPIVATGANPGFVLDLLPLTLCGIAWDVRRLSATRIVDVSVFGPRVRRSLGIDVTRESFTAGLADGRIVGHAGFPESLRNLASHMGRRLERIEVRSDPIIAKRPYILTDGTVIEPGRTVGANQEATGWWRGEPWLRLTMTIHVAPAEDDLTPIDRVHIEGLHEVTVTVEPGFRALLSTAAMIVNSIPPALRAEPGVYGPGDLPLVTAWLATDPPALGLRRARAPAPR
ncbi:MAG: hypothetical protein AB1736_09890 [Chloroflexota bacterium]